MGFKSVYRMLMDVFPQVDNRILRAVAIENSKDADKAAEVVLTEVIPYIAGTSGSANCSLDSNASQEDNTVRWDSENVDENVGLFKISTPNDENGGGDELCESNEKQSIFPNVNGHIPSTMGLSAVSNCEDVPSNQSVVEWNHMFSRVDTLDLNTSPVELNNISGHKESTHDKLYILNSEDVPSNLESLVESNLQQLFSKGNSLVSAMNPIAITEVDDFENEPMEEKSTHELVEEKSTHGLVSFEHEPMEDKITRELVSFEEKSTHGLVSFEHEPIEDKSTCELVTFEEKSTHGLVAFEHEPMEDKSTHEQVSFEEKSTHGLVAFEHEPIEDKFTHELVSLEEKSTHGHVSYEHELIEEKPTNDLDAFEHEPTEEKSKLELLAFDQLGMEDISSREVVELEDGYDLNTEVSLSGNICRINLLENIIEEAKDNKKTLFMAMESVISLMRDVEVREKEAEQVKEEAARGPVDILANVDDLKQMLQHAREANDMHAGEVYGEKAILATEAKELQSRLLCLSDERDNSLAILDDMRRTLEQRSDAAEREMKAAEEEKTEEEECARKALAEQQLLMDKLVQESKILKQEAEENSKLQEFLMERGRVVDMLQGEISVICQDVKLLKQKFDKRVPLSESLYSSQTSCRLASSSSSLKSLQLDQVPMQIETAKKTSPTSSISDSLSSGEEVEANDDEWEFFDKKELNL